MNRMLTIEIYEEDGENCVYISEDGASGSKYYGEGPDRVAECVKQYLKENPVW